MKINDFGRQAIFHYPGWGHFIIPKSSSNSENLFYLSQIANREAVRRFYYFTGPDVTSPVTKSVTL